MKRIKSAKQLTFTYFSVVAFAIIVIHFSVLESTIENLENFNAQNRLEMAATQLQEGNDTTSVQTLDSYTTAYIGLDAVPEDVPVPAEMPWNQAVEVYKRSRGGDRVLPDESLAHDTCRQGSGVHRQR